ncbi:MAG: zinc-ribbon domain-containing protein, partial [Ktedonobacteraceae bacterium]
SKPSKPAPRHIRHLAQLGTLPPSLLNQLNTIIARAMAMHQKDRYTSIADFSNDLRKVMNALNALPTAQPTLAPRPVDPNSTQPDLPQLYEAIQSAKLAQSAQPTPDPVQPATPPVQSHSCPRCGKQLVTKAAFCPYCGFSISGGSSPKTAVNTTQAPDNGASSLHNKGTASSQQGSQMGDQQPKQPEARPANLAVSPTPVTPATSVPKPTSRPAAPVSTLPPVQQKKAATPLQAQSTPTTENTLQITPQSSNGTQVQPSRTGRMTKQMVLIILMALVLIILIAIIIFLFVRQAASAQTTIQLPLTLVMQELPHEQAFSSTTTLFTIGVWACSTSIYSFAGGA